MIFTHTGKPSVKRILIGYLRLPTEMLASMKILTNPKNTTWIFGLSLIEQLRGLVVLAQMNIWKITKTNIKQK